ncbi:MAG TPA: N-acetylmuramoyl-L-alanine amidase [Candidatus Acetothermia bacterium]|nr:N-acetylmuramoyl-L-alanine amidase [Candidatus Acetothermia bacterium]
MADNRPMRTRLLLVAAGLVVAALAAAFFLLGGGALAVRSTPERPLVLIDAGHGGRDPGAVHGGVLESHLNLSVARLVHDLLHEDPRIDVAMTRSQDVTVSLEQRIAHAERIDAAIYLSVHANTYFDERVEGMETLVSEKATPGSPSWQFAELLQASVVAATGARDRGVRAQDLYLHRAQMPAVLLEMGFLTHPQERASLLDSTYQQRIARGIYDGIISYLSFIDSSFPQTP